MKLAEMCETSASYIGEIEIGRKFPSIEMIERLAGALDVEPHRFFVDESGRGTSDDQARARAFYAALPSEAREAFLGLITSAIARSLEEPPVIDT